MYRMWLIVLTSCSSAVAAAAPATYYVDGRSPSCSDVGPGTEAIPYCTISAAVSARRSRGTTILVKPAVYREQVTVPASGDSANPYVIRALGSPVIVDGSDDYSSPNLWRRAKRSVWRAETVTWAPGQVFADGVRLTPTTAGGGSVRIPAGTFRYVEGKGLYVNIGGDNPGLHEMNVGRRWHGFRLSGRTWVTIEGFTVTHAEDKGIYVLNGSHYTTFSGNRLTFNGNHGIGVANCSYVVIRSNISANNANHGISLTTGVHSSTIEDNEAYGNARPEVRAANGIYLYNSSQNVVQRNRVHHNQDTGVEITRNSHANVFLQNLAWSNGDHGFDCIHSDDSILVGNVAWGNFKDGFSVEGEAIRTHIYNCIAVDNGLSTGEYNLFVDPSSAVGFVSSHNIFWNSNGQIPIKYDAVKYTAVEDFRNATGLDAQSIQADPGFVDPANGDFRLLPGSPAIDSGNSSAPFWPLTDARGNRRFDDPNTPNSGTGPLIYSDRGALEFVAQGFPTAVQDQALTGVSLSAAMPNPSSASIRLALDLPARENVAWSILDLQGRILWSEASWREAGRSILKWDGTDRQGARARPGLYFARVNISGRNLTRPIVLIR